MDVGKPSQPAKKMKQDAAEEDGSSGTASGAAKASDTTWCTIT
jgi:hypothetical protein